jgi:hypothetical protein
VAVNTSPEKVSRLSDAHVHFDLDDVQENPAEDAEEGDTGIYF